MQGTHLSHTPWGQFRVTNKPILCVFGLWDETRAPGGNQVRNQMKNTHLLTDLQGAARLVTNITSI